MFFSYIFITVMETISFDFCVYSKNFLNLIKYF